VKPKNGLPNIIAVVGPTASGKTRLGIELAKAYNGEIVSADSRQIYRGMDIGTAKPSAALQKEVKHHLIDIRNPDEAYSAADFQRDAVAAISDIGKRGKLPILVGGTGLYIKAIVENLDIPEVKADAKLRGEIERDISEQGLAAVFEKLVALDPEAAYVVDPQNPRRVVRALEVAMLTGRPFTEQRKKQEPVYNALVIGLDLPPDDLRERIEGRIDRMMSEGLVEEVKGLLKTYRRSDGSSPISFDAIGYREIIEHLDGTSTLEETVSAMKLNTWHFAKRHMTWFKKDKTIHWITNVDDAENEAKKLISSFLT